MNYRLIARLIGNIMKIEAALLIPSVIIAKLYGEDLLPFILSAIIMLLIGFPISLIKPKEIRYHMKEGFVAVAVSWITLSFMGALPYFFSGYFDSYVDCLFESVSGFTTTGATILLQLDSLPKSILFWRSFSQWVGGMGVLVFVLAIMPSSGASSYNLLKAESPGPAPGKFVPRLRESAKIMYIIYLCMTIVQVILLLISGLSLYDSIIHSLSTAGTGGFSNKNISIGEYGNLWVEIICSVFMFLFGINFMLYFYLLKKDIKNFFKDEELRLYFCIVIISIIVIMIDIYSIYGSIGKSLRHASFQVSSIITTTGFSSVNYDLWPSLSKVVLLILMFIGSSAGSTSGGIKVIRILAMFKAVKSEIYKIIHPRVVKPVMINGKKMERDFIMRIAIYFFIYTFILFVSTFLISLEGKDLISSFTSVISAISNIGPGFGNIGPYSNFSSLSYFSKIILLFDMLVGRLEFFPILILFVPSIWKISSTS